MLIAKVQSKEVVQVGTAQELFPHTSFSRNGPDAKFLRENNCFVIKFNKEYNPLIEKIVPCPPYYTAGEVYSVNVVSLTSEEIKESKKIAMNELKEKRNKLLSACDWTQVSDSTVNKKQWAEYRKLLRDFPSIISDARVSYTFPEAPM